MRWFAGIISFLALVIVVLPSLEAQDNKDAKAEEKKDAPDKKDADKKDPEKKDDEKKDAKKDEDKKDDDKGKKKETKKEKEPEEKVVYGQVITAKLKRMDANSARDFAIEIPHVDPMKVFALNMWKTNEMRRIMYSQPQQRIQAMAQFQMQLKQKQNSEIYSMKEMDLRAGENCKVRAMTPLVEFDDKGRLKTYTAKELKALRDSSKLPGYPADFDRLNVGQVVTVYLAKGAKEDGLAKAKKKNVDDDEVMAKPEVVMIVVVQEAPLQPR